MTTKINNEHKKVYVPNLRFPEFQGEWITYKIKDVLSIGNGRDYKHLSNGEIPVFGTGGYMTSVDECLYDGETTFIGRKGSINKPFYYNGKFWTVDTLFYTHSFNGITPKFTYCLFQTINWLKYNEASGVPSLSKDTIEKIKINIPELEEQNKIAKLMFALDERIATQSKIIEDLKKLKSAIIEKVFCSPNKKNPMCRIEGFEQALSTYKMCDFSSRIATKNKDSKCSLVLTIAAQYGLVNQESFFNKSVASENLTGYYLLHKGEFAYNRSYSAGYDWGAVKRLDNYDEGVLSTLYICFKINETIVDSDYLAYYFESTKWHRGLSDIAGEGARNHGLLNVSITDYFNTKHRFPVIEEQKAIAKMLNTITEKERKATLLGECYQKQKQYLLRQMFI